MSSLGREYVLYGSTVVGVILAVIYHRSTSPSRTPGDYFLPVMIGVFVGTAAGIVISSMFPMSP